ncbi:MAG: ROK family protein [Candidatus Nanopelagicales bacterium]
MAKDARDQQSTDGEGSKQSAGQGRGRPTPGIKTLSIDCGGSGLKGSVLDEHGNMIASKVRFPTPYPLPPARFVRTLERIAERLPEFDRVTVGMPGMIRGGRVIETPHYPNVAGPHTSKDPALVKAWRHWDAREKLRAAFGKPTLVLNDAEVQGAAVIERRGLEVMFTLGTGLGCAVYNDGYLAPHLELSQAPIRKDETYDTWIGLKELRKIGARKWSDRIQRVVDGLRPVFVWDHLYVGGGNTRKLVGPLGDDVTVVANVAGILGGVRAWDLELGGA